LSTEDQRIALANLHALSRSALRAKDAPAIRAYLDALADVAPEPADGGEDPRDDSVLLRDFTEDPGVVRRMGAQVRGVILGAGSHTDTVLREVVALVRALDGGGEWTEKKWSPRVEAALAATRADLERDVVFLRPVRAPKTEDPLAFARRWGGVRSLELNAFVATFTRDGTHPPSVASTSKGRDSGALRHAIAVTNAALSIARDADAEDPELRSILEDVERVERALAPLLANLIAAATGR
jgi:hypothetical protein